MASILGLMMSIPLEYVLALAVFPGAAMAQKAQKLQFNYDDIPWQVGAKDIGMGSARLRSGLQVGEVVLNAVDRSVQVHWAASALHNQGQPIDPLEIWDPISNLPGSAEVALDSQLWRVNCYPTAVGKVSDTEVVIAGMRAGEETILQSWSFTWNSAMPQEVYDSSTGISGVAIALPTVKKTTLSRMVGSPKYIMGLCGVRNPTGQCSQLIIQCAEPNDVYIYDLNTGRKTLLASGSDTSAALGVVNSLAGTQNMNHSLIEVYDHKTDGYMYRFWRAHARQGQLSMWLVDGDKNGTIDGVIELTQTELSSRGYLDLRNYKDFWLN